jgi:amino acid adenylation domain-containing protein
MIKEQMTTSGLPTDLCGTSGKRAVAFGHLEATPGLTFDSLNDAQRILIEFNDTSHPYDTNQTIVSMIEAQVERSRQAPAVTCQGETLTYSQLNEHANALAHYLRRQGVGPEVPVALCLERSLDLIVSVLAILKAGGAYVPLDPRYPADRLAFMLRDSGAALLLTRRTMLDCIESGSASRVCLEELGPNLAGESTANPTPLIRPRNLAYIIYTSGSTGVPKGVMLEHRNTVALIEWSREVYSEADLAGVLMSTSLCFDLSVYEMFVTLARGGRLIVVDDVLALPRLPRDSGVTLVNTVPTLFAPLVEYHGIPESVRIVNLAGELLPQELVDRIYANTPVQAVYDLYGPTEATTYALGIKRTFKGPQTIGRPLMNWRVYILDEQRQPVPIGVAGELYIGGPGVARGYRGRPDLTAERFVPDPFFGTPENGDLPRMYRTGDLGRYRPDGLIEFLGRLDNQVKIAGHRIELGEIEAVLDTHPGVRQSVVNARQTTGGIRLAAYVVAAAGMPEPTTEALRRHLAERIPDYMIPRDVVFLEKFPQTPSGKVDRKALPEPDRVRTASVECVVGQGRVISPAQETLTRIWCRLLEVDSVDPDASFFELGGDSMQAVHLSLEIEKHFGMAASLTDLFLAPTIHQQTELIDGHLARFSSEALVPLQPAGSRPPLFIVPGAGGHVIGLRNLAHLLGREHPIFGLQLRGMDGQQEPQRRIEEMAAFFVEEISRKYPRGPYFFIGFSAGGLVAYETARQFRQRGQEVALLALLDTYGPGYPKLLPLSCRVAQHLKNVATLPWPAKGRYVADRWHALIRRIRPKPHPVREATEALPGSVAAGIARTAHGMRDALRAYRPLPYSGSMAIFQAKQPSHWMGSSFEDRTLGWGPLVEGEITTCRVLGEHLELVRESGVCELSVHLRQAVHRAWEQTVWEQTAKA